MEIKIFVNNPWQENTVVLYDRTGGSRDHRLRMF